MGNAHPDISGGAPFSDDFDVGRRSDDELAAQFSGVLDKRRLKALAARRDQLLAM